MWFEGVKMQEIIMWRIKYDMFLLNVRIYIYIAVGTSGIQLYFSLDLDPYACLQNGVVIIYHWNWVAWSLDMKKSLHGCLAVML